MKKINAEHIKIVIYIVAVISGCMIFVRFIQILDERQQKQRAENPIEYTLGSFEDERFDGNRIRRGDLREMIQRIEKKFDHLIEEMSKSKVE